MAEHRKTPDVPGENSKVGLEFYQHLFENPGVQLGYFDSFPEPPRFIPRPPQGFMCWWHFAAQLQNEGILDENLGLVDPKHKAVRVPRKDLGFEEHLVAEIHKNVALELIVYTNNKLEYERRFEHAEGPGSTGSNTETTG